MSKGLGDLEGKANGIMDRLGKKKDKDVKDDVNVDVKDDVKGKTGINDIITSKTKIDKHKRTYYLYMNEINFIDELADQTGRDKSEIVRKAIRLLKEEVEKINK